MAYIWSSFLMDKSEELPVRGGPYVMTGLTENESACKNDSRTAYVSNFFISLCFGSRKGFKGIP